MQRKLEIRQNPSDPLRACVHDLRNLFAVVASAKSLLERGLEEEKRRMVLDALGRVAVEGKIVTDALLAGDTQDRAADSDAVAELRNLAPLIGALEHTGRSIELSIDDRSSWILMAPAEFRAIVLELVTNAAAAGARKIRLRAAPRNGYCWIIVADDGAGFSDRPGVATQAAPGLHGTGMRRLRMAVASAHGVVRIRSKQRRGSIVALILPIPPIPGPGLTRAGSPQVTVPPTRPCTTMMERAA